MLRDKNLIPLSRQHQHALALCVRLNRAQPFAGRDLEIWQGEISDLFHQEMKIHFAAEEEVLFPLARRFTEQSLLVEELVADHGLLRRDFSKAENKCMSADDLPRFAAMLSQHIRKEERQLFERLQRLLRAEEMAALGASLATALQEAAQACSLGESTPGRARKDSGNTD